MTQKAISESDNLPTSPLKSRALLSESASFLLDVIRFSAALLVVLAHSGLPEMSTGFRNRENLGTIAVPVFFVLSGFIIRFVTRSREHTIRDFCIDRAARMYSVILPAMALTVLLAALCSKANRPFYLFYFAAFSNNPVQRIALNLLFLSQSWGHTVIPFINVPFWSLSYECLYYIAYGLLFFLKGYKRLVLAGTWAIVAGPQVLFLLPIWYLGCWIYDLYEYLRQGRSTQRIRLILLPPFVAIAAIYILDLDGLARTLNSIPHPLTLLHIAPYRATMMAFCTGGMAAFAILLLLLWSDEIKLAAGRVWFRRFRHLADGTFTIYLMHYPMMVTASALGWMRPGHASQNIALICAICAICIAAAHPLDMLKNLLRSHLRRLFPMLDNQPVLSR